MKYKSLAIILGGCNLFLSIPLMMVTVDTIRYIEKTSIYRYVLKQNDAIRYIGIDDISIFRYIGTTLLVASLK